MYKYLLCLFLVVAGMSACEAQRYRLRISPQYVMPLGKLAWPYKAGPGYEMDFSWMNDEGLVTKFFGVSVGYTALQPHADTLYYVIDQGGVDGFVVGRAAYSPFSLIQLKVLMDFELPLGKKVAFDIGGSIAYVQGTREISFGNHNGIFESSSESVPWMAVSPKGGFVFKLGKHVHIEPFVSYSLMIQTGSTEEGAMNYNEDTGMTYSFYSTGCSLNFLF